MRSPLIRSQYRRDTTAACERQLSLLADTSIERHVHDKRQSALLHEQNASISNINENTEYLKDSLPNQIQTAVESLTRRIDEIPEMSRQQGEDVYTLLKAIEAQISAPPVQTTFRKRTTQSADDDLAPGPKTTLEEGNSNLTKTLQRLSALVAQKEGTIRNDEADAVIDELELLVQGLPEEHNMSSNSQSKKRKTTIEDGDTCITSRDIKRIRGLITASRSIDVNARRKAAVPSTFLPQRLF